MANKSLNLLIIGKVWPEPDSSAAGSRMLQLIHLFKSQTWKITFASAASETPFMVDLDKVGVMKKAIEINNPSFETFLDDLQPDIVLFDRFTTEEQFGWKVAQQCPAAMRILDTEDLHCLREGRRQAWKKGREFSHQDLISDVAKREIASIWRSDLSIIISAYEMELLQSFFQLKPGLLLHLPFMLKPLNKDTLNKWPNFKERQHFTFIGNFLHEPNWNAVLYLKEEIWPLIRNKIAGVELHIYGAYTPQKAQQLHNEDEGFLIKGRAESANKVLQQARVLLAPLRFGAGLKGKLIDAMLCGTPNVTTEIGSEAMHGDFPWPGQIRNNPEAFAEAAINLYQNEILWKKAQKKIVPIIANLYNSNELGEKFLNRIYKVFDILTEHRNQNFTGMMLQHHTMASTKFMGKWIEEKNAHQ